MHFRGRVWSFAGWFVLLGASLTAQPEPSVGRVLFFPDPNFRGDPLVVEAGQTQGNLHSVRQSNRQRWNDAISSVRVEGPVRAIVYGDANYKGERLEIRRDLADLAALPHGPSQIETWDDRISSIKVEVLPDAVITPGAVVPFFRSQREADRAIDGAYRDLLGRGPDYEGRQNYRRRLLDQGWSEERMRQSIRESAEFKGRDFEGIARRVYKEVLGRDPEAGGLATYTRRLREGLSEADLRSEIKRSPEARERTYREVVTKAYRDLLGREPDESGLATYVKLQRDFGWNEQRVRDALKASDEFRQRGK